ncbi:serine/threonine protein kinase [Planctomyces sp. SH-PL14]|uniref:serine/threonine protein kinase n=1 Tax=Planctomyces sp. SH-PL14 TaxID=1632864 RepID=UPI00078C71E2|nr:serine/threonine-protein kinase [Planctomyces sp. SH-PL14]AMV20130.1 Serine/threonine-protein kinase PknB [Planctomyces sp. SH-PL14]
MADKQPENERQIDQYQLVNVIATGGISQVWEVRHLATQQPYAMKLLLPEAFQDKEQRAEIKTEANTAKLFEHPNIIRVLDVNVSRDHAYFLMEHFRASNLKQMIRGDLAGAQARMKKIAEGLASALTLVHDKGWLHRDIKPENILVNRSGEIRLIDFSLSSKIPSGLAKMMTAKSRVVIQGTRTYIAPELVERQLPGIPSEIYSMGVLFYEILTGRPPFVSKNPNDLLMMHVRDIPEHPAGYNPNVSPEMDQLVMKMLAKKPKDRPQNMNELFTTIRSMPFFKEDPEKYHRTKAQAASEKQAQSLDVRLDSRVDAGRTPEERALVAKAAKEKLEASQKKKAEIERHVAKTGGGSAPAPAPAAASPAPQAPPPNFGYGMPGYPPGYPMPMPGMMPGMPPGGMPGMGFPGMPFPGMPGMPGPGGMPVPGGMPGAMPGMPMPGAPMPGMPGGQMPGGMPMPAGMPVPGAPPRPAAPAAAQPAPVPAKAAPPKAAPAPPPKPQDDIPLMDELPDVL